MMLLILFDNTIDGDKINWINLVMFNIHIMNFISVTCLHTSVVHVCHYTLVILNKNPILKINNHN